jgi:hypothetical protein
MFGLASLRDITKIVVNLGESRHGLGMGNRLSDKDENECKKNSIHFSYYSRF